ncbi:MAG: phosphotransferase [Proteobacteria bacterium]|nr:phosphotransferase [Pseudomonadota bacterium]
MALAPVSRAAESGEDVIATFLRDQGWGGARQTPVQEDFSGRLYRRLHGEGGGPGAILMRMHRPPELKLFMNMQKLLEGYGIRVPAIHAVDFENGLALLEDLGEARFDRLLNAEQSHEKLYPIAVDALVHLHQAAAQLDATRLGVPHFNEKLFLEQVSLFLDVYGEKFLGQPFPAATRAAFVEAWAPLKSACAIAQSLIFRDCHAENILYLANEKGHRRAGIIDFQDGGVGPVNYDLISLLEDARRDVPDDLRHRMTAYYLERSKREEPAAFSASYPVVAAQRHLRVIAITGRRWLEKGEPLVADYFRRSWRMLDRHSKTPALAPLFTWLDQNVPEARRDVPPR